MGAQARMESESCVNPEGGQIYNLLCELKIVEKKSSRQPAAFDRVLFGAI